LGELAFGRQALAGLQPASIDKISKLFKDLVGDPFGLDGL